MTTLKEYYENEGNTAKAQALKAVKKARRVYGYVLLNADCGCYIQLVKKDALVMIDNSADSVKMRVTAENDIYIN